MAVVAAETRVGVMLAGTMGRGTTSTRPQSKASATSTVAGGVPLGSPSTTSVADVPGPESGCNPRVAWKPRPGHEVVHLQVIVVALEQ